MLEFVGFLLYYSFSCLIFCDAAIAAFGFLNHWLTVFNDEGCNSATVVTHEVGHNIGLDHSTHMRDSSEQREYGDWR